MSKSQAQESAISDSESNCESRFECPICLAWLKDPILTQCGHRFCKTCIYDWLKKEKACPVDNIKLSIESDLFPDNFTRREILHQKASCPYTGCSAKIPLPEFDNHLAICSFRDQDSAYSRKCIYYDIGCETTFDNIEEKDCHMTQSTNLHLQLLFKEYLELRLKNNVASKSQETNYWDPPSKHNDSNGFDSNEPVENLIKGLFEKVVTLEQKNQEQQIIISNMSDQITGLKNDVSLRYCNGTYIWTLTDFKQKLEFMFQDNKKMYYSPGFYASPNGYKLCVRMNLSPYDPTHMAIIVHFMKSENDFCLDWPVQGKIIITIIHPSAPKMNLVEVLLTRPDLEAFNKPTQNINPRGFGYTEFALVEDLRTQGYITDNKLHIKIQVLTT